MQKRHATVAIFDQGLSSGSNLVLALIVSRVGTAQELGSFTIAFTWYLVSIGLVRGMINEPLLIFARRSDDHPVDMGYLRTASRLGGLLAVQLFFIGLIVAVAAPHALDGFLAAFAIATPAACLQDTVRISAFARLRPTAAVLSDVAWLVLEIPLLIGLATGAIVLAPHVLVLVWGLFGLLSALPFLPLTFRGEKGTSWRSVAHTNRELSPALFLDFVSTQLSTQAALLIAVAIVGTAAVGAYRAVLIVFGPLGVAFFGLRTLLLPNIVGLKDHPERLRRSIIEISALCAGGAVAITAIVAVVPTDTMRSLLGSSWPAGLALLVATGVAQVLNGAGVGPRAGLRVLTDGGAIVTTRVGYLVTCLVAAPLGAALIGITGFSLGLAAAELALTTFSWVALRTSFRRRTVWKASPLEPALPASPSG